MTKPHLNYRHTQAVPYEAADKIFTEGARAALDELGKKPRLMDIWRDGGSVEMVTKQNKKTGMPTLTLSAPRGAKAVEVSLDAMNKLASEVETLRKKLGDQDTKHKKLVASQDEVIAKLRASLEAKGQENEMLARAKAGEVKFTIVEARR